MTVSYQAEPTRPWSFEHMQAVTDDYCRGYLKQSYIEEAP